VRTEAEAQAEAEAEAVPPTPGTGLEAGLGAGAGEVDGSDERGGTRTRRQARRQRSVDGAGPVAAATPQAVEAWLDERLLAGQADLLLWPYLLWPYLLSHTYYGSTTWQVDILPPAAPTLTPLDLPSPARRALGGGAGSTRGTGGAAGGAASDWQSWCCASLLRIVGAELLVEMLSAAAQALLTMTPLTMALLTMAEMLFAAAQEGSLHPATCIPRGTRLQPYGRTCATPCPRPRPRPRPCPCPCPMSMSMSMPMSMSMSMSMPMSMSMSMSMYTCRRGRCCCFILTVATLLTSDFLTMAGGVAAAARRRVARSHRRRRRACCAPRALSVAGRLPTRTSAEDA
jgi:hypothetical protein